MPKSKHIHVFASNLDTPANELQCRDEKCNKVVSVEDGEKYNAEHINRNSDSRKNDSKKS